MVRTFRTDELDIAMLKTKLKVRTFRTDEFDITMLKIELSAISARTEIDANTK